MRRPMQGEQVAGTDKRLEDAAVARAEAALTAEGVDEGGDVVTVTMGAEKFAPVQYHSFDIGPFMVSTVRRPGETMEAVRARVMPALREMAREEFEARLPLFLARVRQAGAAAQGAAGRRV